MLQEIAPNELIDKIKNGDITYDQLYNLDVEMPQHYAIQHYYNYQKDSIEAGQNLNTLLFDIEVYSYNTGEFKPDEAKSPISAICIYSTFEKCYHVFFILIQKNAHLFPPEKIPEVEEDIRKELVDHKYLSEDDSVKLHMYIDDEVTMLTDCWNHIHTIDPAILTGFYADKFDLPYIYNRLTRLLGDDKKAAQVLSKLGVVKVRKMGSKGIMYNIAEYPLLDIQYLYKPRDEGGLNYGKKQASYSLDFISQAELKGLKKIEYKDGGLSLDRFYETDPIGYIKYNVVDVALIKLLNDKLQHIDLHNMLRRDMKTPLSLSLRGSSALFDTYFSYELEQKNQLMRWGVVNEISNSLNKKDISEIPKPKEKSIKWTLKKVEEKMYRKIVSRYPGALNNVAHIKFGELRETRSINLPAILSQASI